MKFPAVALALLIAGIASADMVAVKDWQELAQAIQTASGPRTVVLPNSPITATQPLTLRSDITILGQPNSAILMEAGILSRAEVIPIAITARGEITQSGSITSANGYVLEATFAEPISTGSMLSIDLGNELDRFTTEVISVISPGKYVTRNQLPEGLTGLTVSAFLPIENVRLTGFRIEGFDKPFEIDLARNIRIDRMTQTNNQAYGTISNSVAAVFYSSILETSGGGVFFQNTSNAYVHNNTIDQHEMAGVFFRSVFDGFIEGNSITGIPGAVAWGGNGDAITIAECGRVYVRNNQIADTSCYGIWVLLSDSVFLEGNQATNTYTTSYYLDRSTNVSAIGNNATNNIIGFGITAMDCAGIEIRDNQASFMPRGFYVVGNQGLTHSNNVSTNCANPDIYENNN